MWTAIALLMFAGFMVTYIQQWYGSTCPYLSTFQYERTCFYYCISFSAGSFSPFFPLGWHRWKPFSNTSLSVTHWTNMYFLSIWFNWSCKLKRLFDYHFLCKVSRKSTPATFNRVWKVFYFFSEYVNTEMKRLILWCAPALLPTAFLLETSVIQTVQRKAPSLWIPWTGLAPL